MLQNKNLVSIRFFYISNLALAIHFFHSLALFYLLSKQDFNSLFFDAYSLLPNKEITYLILHVVSGVSAYFVSSKGQD